MQIAIVIIEQKLKLFLKTLLACDESSSTSITRCLLSVLDLTSNKETKEERFLQVSNQGNISQVSVTVSFDVAFRSTYFISFARWFQVMYRNKEKSGVILPLNWT